MSVNQNVLACVPSSIGRTNAESSANNALSTWKSMSFNADWNQETADAAGEAASRIALDWTNAVIPELLAEVDKWQEEYDEKKSNYEAAKKEKKDANEEWHSYEKTEYTEYKNTGSGGGLIVNDTNSGGSGNYKKTEYISDPIAYRKAKEREKAAEAEMKRWEKQMNAAKEKLDDAEEAKEAEENKIERFILDVYEISLMNESVAFLSAVKASGITLKNGTKHKLFGRLFFIQNPYRKQFEAFEKTITDTADKYAKKEFSIAPESLDYTAERKFKAKKFKGKINISLTAKDTYSAELAFEGKNEFIIPKKKQEKAKEAVEAVCKGYALSISRSNFTLTLDQHISGDDLPAAVDALDAQSDAYTNEGITLLDTMLANGASASKIRVLIGKITNWHLDHWKKLWYKIVCIASPIALAALICAIELACTADARFAKKAQKNFDSWYTTEADAIVGQTYTYNSVNSSSGEISVKTQVPFAKDGFAYGNALYTVDTAARSVKSETRDGKTYRYAYFPDGSAYYYVNDDGSAGMAYPKEGAQFNAAQATEVIGKTFSGKWSESFTATISFGVDGTATVKFSDGDKGTGSYLASDADNIVLYNHRDKGVWYKFVYSDTDDSVIFKRYYAGKKNSSYYYTSLSTDTHDDWKKE